MKSANRIEIEDVIDGVGSILEFVLFLLGVFMMSCIVTDGVPVQEQLDDYTVSLLLMTYANVMRISQKVARIERKGTSA